MNVEETVIKLRADGAIEPIEIFLFLANHAHELRTADGQRMNDATDFTAFLRELADALAPAKQPKLACHDTCPRCGHIHQGEEECGMFMGATAGFCRCEVQAA